MIQLVLLPLNTRKKSLDYVINRLYIKLFKTTHKHAMSELQEFFKLNVFSLLVNEIN